MQSKIFPSCFWFSLTFAAISASLIAWGQDEASSSASTEAATPTLILRVGQRYPLEGLVPTDASTQPPGVVDIEKLPGGMILVGRAPGETALTLQTHEKPVVIAVKVQKGGHSTDEGAPSASGGPGWSQFFSEVQKIPGLRFSALGSRLVIQGEILGRSAYQKLLLLMTVHPKKVLLLAKPAPGVVTSLIEQAESQLRNRGLYGVNIHEAGNHFFLDGTVATPEEVEIALAVVEPILHHVVNRLPIPIRLDPTIVVRIFMLELSRTAHELLGLRWPTGPVQGLIATPNQILFSPQWVAQLQHLSQEGEAKVLSEPVVSLKTGATAELSAGGEIPLKLTGKFENKVLWKSYGLKTKIQILGVVGKILRLKIQTEQSELDGATAVDGVPGIKRNQLETEIDATAGTPILLTGLFQSASAKSVDRVPLLGHIPLLGELFRTRDLRESENELLIALLPTFGAQPAPLPLRSRYGLHPRTQWNLKD